MRRTPPSGTAVVCGAGIGGLFAARVLAKYFSRVVLLDKDRLSGSGPRQYAPQGRHVSHVLMPLKRAMAEYFPGADERLARAGAPNVDWSYDTLLIKHTGRQLRTRTKYVTRACSRPLLEATLRELLREQTDNVTLVEECSLRNLILNSRGEVEGVETESHRNSTIERQTLSADVVVNASGRGAGAETWRQTWAMKPPAETVVDAGLNYVSSVVRLSPATAKKWKRLFSAAKHGAGIVGGVIAPIENDLHTVLVAGFTDGRFPRDPSGLIDATREMVTADFWEALAAAQFVEKITAFKGTWNRWRNFDEKTEWPRGYLALGDAVCTLNPSYGQGMAVAALQAQRLDRLLGKRAAEAPAASFSYGLQRAVQQVARPSWDYASAGDAALNGPVVHSPRSRFRSWASNNLGLAFSLGAGHCRAIHELQLRKYHMDWSGWPKWQPMVLLGLLRTVLRHPYNFFPRSVRNS